jgi:hypothetical protein
MNYTIDPTSFTESWDFALTQVYMTSVSAV